MAAGKGEKVRESPENVFIFSLLNLDLGSLPLPLLLPSHGGPALASPLTAAQLTSAGASQGDTLYTQIHHTHSYTGQKTGALAPPSCDNALRSPYHRKDFKAFFMLPICIFVKSSVFHNLDVQYVLSD